ncbi:hypothetical protein HaLaN_03585, partial [Haematococcus lacustris]
MVSYCCYDLSAGLGGLEVLQRGTGQQVNCKYYLLQSQPDSKVQDAEVQLGRLEVGLQHIMQP